MREIKSLTVVCQQGVKDYILGQEVNGLKIAKIVETSFEGNESLLIGYVCLSDNEKISRSNTVAQFWGVPVVAEYYEVGE